MTQLIVSNNVKLTKLDLSHNAGLAAVVKTHSQDPMIRKEYPEFLKPQAIKIEKVNLDRLGYINIVYRVKSQRLNDRTYTYRYTIVEYKLLTSQFAAT